MRYFPTHEIHIFLLIGWAEMFSMMDMHYLILSIADYTFSSFHNFICIWCLKYISCRCQLTTLLCNVNFWINYFLINMGWCGIRLGPCSIIWADVCTYIALCKAFLIYHPACSPFNSWMNFQSEILSTFSWATTIYLLNIFVIFPCCMTLKSIYWIAFVN